MSSVAQRSFCYNPFWGPRYLRSVIDHYLPTEGQMAPSAAPWSTWGNLPVVWNFQGPGLFAIPRPRYFPRDTRVTGSPLAFSPTFPAQGQKVPSRRFLRFLSLLDAKGPAYKPCALAAEKAMQKNGLVISVPSPAKPYFRFHISTPPPRGCWRILFCFSPMMFAFCRSR